MKNIIYYFSGTGNSLRAAIGIAERIGDAEVISVRCNAENTSAETAEVTGFVCPVYEKLNMVISKRLCLPEKRKKYHHPFITANDLMMDKQYIESKSDTR